MNLYIITGASRGIGANLVGEVLQHPDNAVLAVSRRGSPATDSRVQDVRADLAETAGQRSTMQAIQAKLGEREWSKAVLINNAGMVEPLMPVERMDLDVLARSISLNLTATIGLMQAFLAASRSVPQRRIINISTGATRNPHYGWAAYCSAKIAVDMASSIAALEAAADGSGVCVTSLSPGMADTDMQDVLRSTNDADHPDAKTFRQHKAQGTLQKPEDVASKILALELAGKLPAGVAALAALWKAHGDELPRPARTLHG